jgi:aminopeptidase
MGATLLNIPTGEVYFAPDEPTFSGTAVFDLVMREGTRIEDLELYFNEGRTQAISAKSGLDDYHKLMQGASGDKDVIAEIGIGLNPIITKMTGYMLTDEKIIGTSHLAIGNNITMGGKNHSDIHWDMIIDRPTILIGDELLRKDGEFAAEYQMNNI